MQILPVGADVDVHTIGAKSITEVIYCFEKFTIGKDKVLLAEVLEQGGDRNIGLRIPETFIIEARKLRGFFGWGCRGISLRGRSSAI